MLQAVIIPTMSANICSDSTEKRRHNTAFSFLRMDIQKGEAKAYSACLLPFTQDDFLKEGMRLPGDKMPVRFQQANCFL